MKFREHRGGLTESLDTTVEVAGMADILKRVQLIHGWNHILLEDLAAEPYGGDDDRIGWKDVHIITVNGAAFGFTEGRPA
jgi:hypothetical protein